MFENFAESDFKNLNGIKTASELTSTKGKLEDLQKELEEEISKRWKKKFKSNIGGLYPFGDKLINRIWIAFTQGKSRAYIPYPQLNIKISEKLWINGFGFNSFIIANARARIRAIIQLLINI